MQSCRLIIENVLMKFGLLTSKWRIFAVSSVVFVMLHGCASTEELYAQYDILCCLDPKVKTSEDVKAEKNEPDFAAASMTNSENKEFITKPISKDELALWEPAVFFGYNKAIVRASGAKALKRNVRLLSRHPDLSIAVQGSADKRGNDRYNVQLSLRRVDAVIDFLTDLGIDRARIHSVANGARYAGAISVSERVHALHRRADLFLLTPNDIPMNEGLDLDLLVKSKITEPE